MLIMVFIIAHGLGMYYTELMRSCLATVLKEYLQENYIQEKYIKIKPQVCTYTE